MEAKNLRIGNFVKDRGNKVIRIDFMEYQESGYSTKFGQRMFLCKEEVHPMTEYTDYSIPIEITGEWLLKLGFEETYNSQFRLKYDHSLNYIGFDLSKTDDKSMEGFRYYGHYIKIKYIHELQNLFFALTGMELSIENVK